ncbi:hypothetical protein DH2020_003233 [Rehmannia glutinosa]|uniref:MADS-box domain-containing protein n=1 Tax=Rehmannia glutinosa TaxID=99300 RepID=A0ABR0XL15_REHGL
MENNAVIKKTKGRRKIEIKKIEKKSHLQVTFTKRKMGLFKKASELSVLCGAQILILVQSPAGKMFSFGHPCAETLIDSFDTGVVHNFVEEEEGRRSKYEEAVMRRVEMEKRMKEEKKEAWWDEPFESMELHELEEYLEALQGLRDNVMHRVEEMNVGNLGSTSSNHVLGNSVTDHDEDLDFLDSLLYESSLGSSPVSLF